MYARELGLQELLERSQLRRYRFNRVKPSRKGVGGLKAVAGDAEHSRLIRTDPALRVKLAR
jgi:hypothetical protein